VIEGELPPAQIAGDSGPTRWWAIVERPRGERHGAFAIGDRVGHRLAFIVRMETCEYCKAGAENLCDNPMFTGYSVNGGYAEYIVAPEDFIYALPAEFPR